MRCASRELPNSPTETSKDNNFGVYNTRSQKFNVEGSDDSSKKLNIGEIDIKYLQGINIQNQNQPTVPD